MKNAKSKTIQKFGIKLIVTSDGKHVINKKTGKEYKQHLVAASGYPSITLYSPIKYKKTGKGNTIVYVHHLVMQAFGLMKKPRGKDIQIDHINGNPKDNRISNLRWVTRKQNNSRKSKRILQSKNHVHHNHTGQIIFGYNRKTGETKTWENGIRASKDIGCSHVLVYNTLNPEYPVSTAKGWSLMWIEEEERLDAELFVMLQNV